MTEPRTENAEELGKVSNALGEPVLYEANQQALKTRTHLMAVSVLSIIIVLYELKIGPDSSILGLKIQNLNDGVVRSILIWIIIYLLCHFLWLSMDGFREWRLRITGSRVAFQTVGRFADSDCDYPSDPRQSTLYNW